MELTWDSLFLFEDDDGKHKHLSYRSALSVADDLTEHLPA